eukprot:PITA_30570
MVNGSLWEFLGGASKPNHKLYWRSRYNIALGVAEGLKYLHHDCEPPIIHCDIKSANILLDHEYVAHIADFGLAKILKSPSFNSSLDSESSSLFGGTHGYIAPECGYGVKASTKQDVYSFGVVLLELVSGKRPVLEEDDQKFVHLPAWVESMTKEGKMDEIIDEDLRRGGLTLHSNMKDEIMKMMEIASVCTRSAHSLRPSMNVVLDMLISANRDRVIEL